MSEWYHNKGTKYETKLTAVLPSKTEENNLMPHTSVFLSSRKFCDKLHCKLWKT